MVLCAVSSYRKRGVGPLVMRQGERFGVFCFKIHPDRHNEPFSVVIKRGDKGSWQETPVQRSGVTGFPRHTALGMLQVDIQKELIFYFCESQKCFCLEQERSLLKRSETCRARVTPNSPGNSYRLRGEIPQEMVQTMPTPGFGIGTGDSLGGDKLSTQTASSLHSFFFFFFN